MPDMMITNKAFIDFVRIVLLQNGLIKLKTVDYG